MEDATPCHISLLISSDIPIIFLETIWFCGYANRCIYDV